LGSQTETPGPPQEGPEEKYTRWLEIFKLFTHLTTDHHKVDTWPFDTNK